MVQTQPTPALACNLGAISAADRLRYAILAKRVKAAISDPRELPGGYVFTIGAAEMSLPDLAEWVSFERLCCPFLTFQIEVSGREAVWRMTLTGPTGVKSILEHEFAALRKDG